MYRRVQDLGFRGAGQHDPHMANKMGHARARAKRERQRRKFMERRKNAACYSLKRPQCDRENDEAPLNGSCVHPAADHLAAFNAHTICGTPEYMARFLILRSFLINARWLPAVGSTQTNAHPTNTHTHSTRQTHTYHPTNTPTHSTQQTHPLIAPNKHTHS